MINKFRYRIITAILLLPLFFINVKDSHDWGDDFAQYLLQARNIVDGRPQTDNGLLVNIKDPVYAIEAYPVGFPLLISPIYNFSKLSIFPYCILISLILFICGILCFEFFRKRTGEFTSLILTLLFCYNANIIDLKKQILSEIPFTCLLMFLLLWPELNAYKKKYSWIITGILLSYLISIRLAGLAAVVAFALFELNKVRLKIDLKERSDQIVKLLFSLLATFFFFILMNHIWFPIKAGGLLSFYSSAFVSHDIQAANNLSFYYIVSEFLFPFYGKWVPSFWILIAISGWLIRSIKTPSFSEYFFPIYSILIIFYPYSNAGLRFLLPILPLLLFYSGYFICWSFGFFGEKTKWISTGILVVALSAYLTPLKGIISTQLTIEDGPEQKESIELFNYLKTKQPTSAIVFCKARAMSLYSGHSSLYMAKNQSNKEAFVQFHRYNMLYLVVAKVNPENKIYDPRLLNFISTYKENYEHVWENGHFDVYKQRL